MKPPSSDNNDPIWAEVIPDRWQSAAAETANTPLTDPLAAQLASVGIGLPLIVLIASPVVVVMHFLIRDLRVWWWWIPQATVLAVSVGVIILAFVALAPASKDRGRQRTIRKLVGGLCSCFVSGGVFIACALVMSGVLYVKSDEGQRAIGASKQKQRAAAQQQAVIDRQKAIARQQAQFRQDAIDRQEREELRRAEMAELQEREQIAREQRAIEAAREREKRIAEIKENDRKRHEAERVAAAEKREQEKLARERKEREEAYFQHAAIQMFAFRDEGQPLRQDLPLPAEPLNLKSRYEKFAPQPVDTDEELLGDSFDSHILLVQRLNVSAPAMVPMIACDSFAPLNPRLWLVEKQGRLLQISLPDYRVRRTWELGVHCSSLQAMDHQVRILSDQPGALITMEMLRDVESHYKPKFSRLHLNKPVRAAGYQSSRVETATSTPLLGPSTYVEVERARGPTEERMFLPTQLGRDMQLIALGVVGNQNQIVPGAYFFAARKDGIYRGQVKLKYSLLIDDKYVRAHFDLAGKNLCSEVQWEPKEVSWQQVMPATGIDVEKFTTLGENCLATCNAKSNLLLFDAEGHLQSSHVWPEAGKTLAIEPIPALKQLVVFTEKQVYLVTVPLP